MRIVTSGKVAWSAFISAAIYLMPAPLAAGEGDGFQNGSVWKGEVFQGTETFPATLKITKRDNETIHGEVHFVHNGNEKALSFVGRIDGKSVTWMTDKLKGSVTYPGLYVGQVAGDKLTGIWEVPSAKQKDRFRFTLEKPFDPSSLVQPALRNLTNAVQDKPKPDALDFSDPKKAADRCLETMKKGKGLRQFVESIGAKHRQAWEKAAKEGNADAEHLLGMTYEFGLGVSNSHSDALGWYQKSAAQKNHLGLLTMGNVHRNGFAGVTRSPAEARAYYLKAAEAGNSDAYIQLGFLDLRGEGVSKSPEKAIEWFEKAAKEGHTTGMNQLGLMFDDGNGVPKSHEKAFAWYEKAAELGNAVSMHNVAVSYRRGEGVAQDIAKARVWDERAERAGYKAPEQTVQTLPPSFYRPLLRTSPSFQGGRGSPQQSQQLERMRREAEQRAREEAEDAVRRFQRDLRNR